MSHDPLNTPCHPCTSVSHNATEKVRPFAILWNASTGQRTGNRVDDERLVELRSLDPIAERRPADSATVSLDDFPGVRVLIPNVFPVGSRPTLKPNPLITVTVTVGPSRGGNWGPSATMIACPSVAPVFDLVEILVSATAYAVSVANQDARHTSELVRVGHPRPRGSCRFHGAVWEDTVSAGGVDDRVPVSSAHVVRPVVLTLIVRCVPRCPCVHFRRQEQP